MTIIILASGRRVVLEHVNSYQLEGDTLHVDMPDDSWSIPIADNVEALGEFARFFGDKALGKELHAHDLSDLPQL
jgi:hypothetical protein